MSDEKFSAEDAELDQLFQQYRSACPDLEPGANFMPALWKKIESRRNLWFHFGRLGKNALAMSGALCLVLLALNFTTSPEVITNYADAFLPDDANAQGYTSEVLRPALPNDIAPLGQR